MSRARLFRAAAVVCSSGLAACSCGWLHARDEQIPADTAAAFEAVWTRLSPLLEVGKMSKRGTWDGVTVYSKPGDGKSVFRTGQVVVNVPAKVVADIFWQWDTYKVFDSKSTADSKLLKAEPPRLAWLLSVPKPLISPRDFVVLSRRTESPDGGVLFVNVSMPTAHPATSSVRGDVWSLLKIQPHPEGDKKAKSCLCTYTIEVQPHGWLPMKAVDMAADDMPLALVGLKALAEKSAA
eukprot:RCo053859